jgi:hypothetical protein
MCFMGHDTNLSTSLSELIWVFYSNSYRMFGSRNKLVHHLLTFFFVWFVERNEFNPSPVHHLTPNTPVSWS